MIFKAYLLIGILFCCAGSQAQMRIPTFDVELKVHQNLIPGSGGDDGSMEFVETTNFYGAAHVQINQYVAIGGFYSRSFRGEAAFTSNGGDNNSKTQAFQLQKGLDLRLSTSRAKKMRYYLSVNYLQVELVQDNEVYRTADKSNAFGGSLGMMRRLSNNLYLNVIELGVKVMSEEIFWFNTTKDKFIMDAKMGLTYNIGRKK
jgi:hypothetical protein